RSIPARSTSSGATSCCATRGSAPRSSSSGWSGTARIRAARRRVADSNHGRSVPDTLRDFAGRVALVTGAARGLGRAAAARLHERGARVAVNVRGADRAEAAARAIGEGVLGVPGDLSAAGVPETIVAQTLDRFGRIDILINNAALPLTTRFEQISAEEWRHALEVNLTAPFLLMQLVLPAMKRQPYGRIVNIPATAGRLATTL